VTAATHRTRTTAETIALGRDLAAPLRAGDIVLLCGPMGAGKTYLAKGLIAGLGGGEEDDVASPAYDIVHQFQGRETVYHYDLFRLQQLSGEDIEWMMELLQENGVHVIEWGDRIETLLRRRYTKVEIAFGEGDERIISVASVAAL